MSINKNENLTAHQRIFISMPIKDFSTFLSKITKYNRVPLGFDPSVARLLGHDPTPRPTCLVRRASIKFSKEKIMLQLKKKELNGAHSPVKSAEKSRNCFLTSVHPAEFTAKVVRCSGWKNRLMIQPQSKPVMRLNETLAKRHMCKWTTWRSLNRQRTGNHAAKNSEGDWATTRETRCANMDSYPRIPSTCHRVHSLHNPAHWMTF